MRRMRWLLAALPLALLLALLPTTVAAQEAVSTADLARGINTVWVLITAFLVFFMQAGFAFLEAGSTNEKNTVSILMKNVLDFAVGTLAFWAFGYALMYGNGTGLIGTSAFFLIGMDYDGDVPGLAFWLFQLMFAGTAATIVSGAMAERTRFVVYLAISVVMTGLIYPVFGHWTWSGQGWLAALPLGDGFHDFAGSTVVHSVGGWVALVGAITVGARIGRFDGGSNTLRGQSVPFAALGVFILWLGWFGFNPGSQLAAIGSNADAIALVAANTNLAAAMGGLGSLVLVRIIEGTWRLTTTLNGVLGGLVAITAACNVVMPAWAIVIGIIGGMITVLATWWLESVQIDDPVGAVPVHLFAGIWGTLAVGLFATDTGVLMGHGFGQLAAQLVGIVVCAAWSAGSAFIFFRLARLVVGDLRVTPLVEAQGLDAAEHGETGYPRLADAEEESPSVKRPRSPAQV